MTGKQNVICVCSDEIAKFVETTRKFTIIRCKPDTESFGKIDTNDNIAAVLVELSDNSEKIKKINDFISDIALEFPIAIIGISSIMIDENVLFEAFKAGVVECVPVKGIPDENWLEEIEDRITYYGSLHFNTKEISTHKKACCSKMLVEGKHGKMIFISGGIGAIESLFTFVPDIPENIPCMIAYLRLPFPIINKLAPALDAVSQIHVNVAASGDTVEPGTLYIAQYGTGISITDGTTITIDRNKAYTTSEVIEHLITEYGRDLVCVVLGSELRDVNDGAAEVKKRNGSLIIQNRKTSRVHASITSMRHLDTSLRMFGADEIGYEIIDQINILRGMSIDKTYYK